MEEIHQGLSNRDIMEGSAADYGLVKVTTCNVSGQLATDACRSDVMNYGTTTDYWPRDNAPTVQCQMHYALNVCNDTGLLATDYCPSVSHKGVVILPMGHPLYEFAGGEYSAVLADYLGEYATLRLTSDGNANAAMLRSISCSLHRNAQSYENYWVQSQLLPDAQRLLIQAQNQLTALPASHWGYDALLSAINELSNVINSYPSSDALAAAMSRLTQAMANAQY